MSVGESPPATAWRSNIGLLAASAGTLEAAAALIDIYVLHHRAKYDGDSGSWLDSLVGPLSYLPIAYWLAWIAGLRLTRKVRAEAHESARKGRSVSNPD